MSKIIAQSRERVAGDVDMAIVMSDLPEEISLAAKRRGCWDVSLRVARPASATFGTGVELLDDSAETRIALPSTL
jgi:hypothetical protein